ncbi:guanine nucleotide exchange factor subunit RIC1-like isoform X2 [Convolutriloba macropyga]|uniref:guanine nucleotide exchange factor subunit RIC1-like isoform X2 n=1 Tax=Convolutriloba macropyga TaxID=536237 RepID=UPI003F51D5D3
MLYPCGAPSSTRSLSGVTTFEFSPDGLLGAALSETNLSVVLLHPITKLSSCTRSFRSLRELGINEAVTWSGNSNKIAVATASGSCILFQLIRQRSPDVELYFTQLNRQGISTLKRCSFPDYTLSQLAVISIGAKIDSFCSVGDQLCVADNDGNLKQFNWSDGLLVGNQSKPLSTIPFAFDLHPSRDTHVKELPSTTSLLTSGVHVMCLCNALATMGGLLAVLSDGRAAILATESAAPIDFNHMQGILAPNVSDAVWVCNNSRLRHMVICTKSASILLFALNEITNELILVCKYEIKQKISASQSSRAYATEASVAIDGMCLCVVLNTGSYQLYSIFGSLLWEADPNLFSKSRVNVAKVTNSGYQLWLCVSSDHSSWCFQPSKSNSGSNPNSAIGNGSSNNSPGANSLSGAAALLSPGMRMNKGSITMVQSLVTVSRSTLSSQFGESLILLQGMDRVMLSSNLDFESPDAIKCWRQTVVPLTYLRGDAIVKYSCVDLTGSNIAVASQYGLVLYNLEHLKWKMFGNEIQEKELSVCGGMAWHEEFIVFTCRNNQSSRYEVRSYSRLRNLENSFKSSAALQTSAASERPLRNGSRKPLVVNKYNNFFSVLDGQSTLIMFKLEINSNNNGRTCDLIRIQETPLHMFVPYPDSVLGVMFTDVAAHQMGGHPLREEKPRSFLMNVAGRLAIFPRDPLVEDLEIQDQVPLCSPTLIASNVEFLSLYNSAIPGIARSPYFEDAVWLMCGAFGFKVWLPLPQANEANNEISNDQSFKRSVFVFHPVVYPVAVECNSGFMMGVDSDNSVVATKDIMDILNPPPVAPAKTASEMLGISVASKSVGGTQNSGGQIVANYLVTKTLEMFIPQLVEEMLRRNLNSHAVRLLRSIESVPSFDHMLELLLHNVLETEATANEPIADPLLPCVMGVFNQHYRSKFLRILAKCARKSEVAIWSFLFSTAGNPAHYFKRCLEEEEDLWTAASYMIILQSLEPLSVSKQYANVLVDTCLEKRQWLLVRDIIRFLKSIAASSGDEFSPKVTHTPYSVYSFPPAQVTSSSTSSSAAAGASAVSPSGQISTTSQLHSATSTGGTPSQFNISSSGIVGQSSRTRNSSLNSGGQQVFSASGGTNVSNFSSSGGATAIGYQNTQKTTAVARYPFGLSYYKTSSVSIETDLNNPGGQKSMPAPYVATSADSQSHGGSQHGGASSGNWSSSSRTSGQQQPDSNDIFYLSSLIARRARSLLVNYEVRQLFVMASHIGFNLTSWLKRERNRAAKIENYEQALEKLHVEFEWPFPVLADQSTIEAAEALKSSTLSSSSTTSSVVTLQDLAPSDADFSSTSSAVALGDRNEYLRQYSNTSVGEDISPRSLSKPIAVPLVGPTSGASGALLYSSLNATAVNLGNPGHGSLDQLESLSLDALWGSTGLTPNQSALQHARLQLADLSSSLESNNNYSAGNTPVGVDGYAGERHNGAQGTQDDSSAGGWSDEASDPALPGGKKLAGARGAGGDVDRLIAESVAETAQSQLAQSADLESLVQQFKNKGSEGSGRLLRHVLSVMMESECYEWAILVCLMLSDVTQAISIINCVICSSPHSLTNTAQRLIQGLTALDEWAAENWWVIDRQ